MKTNKDAVPITIVRTKEEKELGKKGWADNRNKAIPDRS